MRALVVEAGGRLCALPLSDVVETMRPLPAAAVAEMPAFVRGIALIRGEPTPVVDLAALVGGAAAVAGRYVTVRCGTRRVALAVASVAGIHAIDTATTALPPLLAAAGEQIDHLATLDHQLLLILRAGRLLPASLLQQLDAAAAEPVQP